MEGDWAQDKLALAVSAVLADVFCNAIGVCERQTGRLSGLKSMVHSEKADLVMRLMNRKQYNELYELLLGISPWNVGQAIEGEPPLESVKLVAAVRSHLQFLARFGEGKKHVTENGMHYFAYPKEFSKWLDEDAPGLTLEELRLMDERTAEAKDC